MVNLLIRPCLRSFLLFQESERSPSNLQEFCADFAPRFYLALYVVFEDVTYFETDCVKDFDADEILEVVLISATQSLEKVQIVTDGVNIIMIEVGNVEWHSL